MKLQTKFFGEVEVDEGTIISFPEGIPGFENFNEYTILKNPDSENPFHWLQCIDCAEVAFAVINPFTFMDEYDFYIPDKTVERLQIGKEEEVVILTIANIPENIEDMTANLKAPLIINIKSRLGKQLILDDSSYPSKYRIIDNSRKG